MEKLPSCPPTRLGTQGICTTTEKVGRKRLPSSPAHRSPLSPRALSYEETASSTASLTAADCARMDNFISTVLLDLPFSRHQVTRARTRMYTDTHTHTHTHTQMYIRAGSLRRLVTSCSASAAATSPSRAARRCCQVACCAVSSLLWLAGVLIGAGQGDARERMAVDLGRRRLTCLAYGMTGNCLVTAGNDAFAVCGCALSSS